MASATADIAVSPFGGTLGADISGLDLARLDDAGFAAVKRAWLTHKVLRFRDQALDDDALAAFSQRFGTLDKADPNGPHTLKKGEKLVLRHRFYLHAGDEKTGGVAAAYERYAKEKK